MATDRTLLYGELFWAFMFWGKYLAYADMMRERYEESLELPETELGPPEESDYFRDPISKSKRSYRLQKDAAIAYYYSSLLPVIEGWKELDLADVAIDVTKMAITIRLDATGMRSSISKRSFSAQRKANLGQG